MRTRLDNYLVSLASQFVVYVRTLPLRTLPAGVVVEVVHSRGLRLVAKNEDIYHALIAALNSEKKLMEQHIETRPGCEWLTAPGSRTYEFVWSLLLWGGLVGMVGGVYFNFLN